MSRPIVNSEYEVIVDNYTSEGLGVCRIFAYPIFVPFSAKGDNLIIKVTKDKKTYFEGEIVNVLEYSKDRESPSCEQFKQCGGCDILHLKYDKQLLMKKQTVENALKKITKDTDINVNDVIGMEKPINYRNKAVFNFQRVNGSIICGFYKKKTYEVIEMTRCNIVHNSINNLKNAVEKFCNEVNFMPKKLILKHSFANNDIMVCLVVSEKHFDYKDELIESLSNIECVKSIIINFSEKNSVNFGKVSDTIFGQDYINENISGIEFKNYLKSFFQVNPTQTDKLYTKAIESLKLSKDDTLLDLYCGVGTISLICAKEVKEVIGVEIVKDAIKSANDNARNNSINNAKFILGDVKDVIKTINLKDKEVKVVVDPPRKGLEKSVIESIISIYPKAIVYVSCNEATMARDLKIFAENGYKAKDITPVDMFCGSHHIESVVSIEYDNQ